MDLSLFLARSWGLSIALICFGLLLHKKRFTTMLTKIDSASFFLIGMLILAVGAAQVVGYEVWDLNWKGLVTLFGWISLMKGVLIIFVPGYAEKFIKLAVKENLYTLSMVVGLVAGLYLLYAGYLMH
ncbi:MAG: hypothetical protein KGJ07_09160 [Patescibacteria group bacterium]|nr:hypothetical protein [Patescibacteria group bacterium]